MYPFYSSTPSFWINLLLIILIVSLVMYGTNYLLRKLFKIEKANDKFYSSNFINDRHKKLDWTIRALTIAFLFIGLFINESRLPNEPIAILEPWNLVFILIGLSELLRSFFQWKYATNRKIYLFTLARLATIGILVISFLSTDFFGIFH